MASSPRRTPLRRAKKKVGNNKHTWSSGRNHLICSAHPALPVPDTHITRYTYNTCYGTKYPAGRPVAGCCSRSVVSLQVCSRCECDTTILVRICSGRGVPAGADRAVDIFHTRRRNMDPNLVGPSRCGHLGCSKRPTYGIEDSAGGRRAQFCAPHAKPGMVNVSRRRCAHVGCMRHPSFAIKGNKSLLFCLQHSTDEMVDIHNIRRCGHEGCVKHPTYGVPGTRKAEFCAPHALDGMVSGSFVGCYCW